MSDQFFEFMPPEDSCHYFFVQARDVAEAIIKFIKWQEKELEENDRWDESEIKDKENWQIDNSIHFIV